MVKRLGSTKFFADTLGAKLRNSRWSWGAMNPNTGQIFLKVWDDQIEFLQGVEHVQILAEDYKSQSAGYADHLKHVDQLRQGTQGIGVLCTANDPWAYPRSIKTFDRYTLLKLGSPHDVGKRVIVPVVERIPVSTLELSLPDELESIEIRYPKRTTRETFRNARIGQGDFRKQVLRWWDRQCCVTGVTTDEVLLASHIKPWRDSDDCERLDPYNGLPLIATMDKLFDNGLVTFSTAGDLLVSKQLDAKEKALLGLDVLRLRQQPDPRTAEYLAYHRRFIFEKRPRTRGHG